MEWRTEQWRQLVGRARARNLVSGLLQVTSAAIAKLAQQGVFDRDDAFEYLANSREAWRSDDEPADDDEDDGQTSLDDLVERLDAIVFGLVEALDADSEELPRLLDEALNGSLWARQVAREPEGIRESQRALILARASIVWRSTDAASRRGHFAMGVGLESGLALDAIADEVGELIDEADAASLRGDEEALGDALVALAGRLLAIRPFVPTPALHAGWEGTLRSWVSGDEVAAIGGDRMKTVEEAFAYRLVWGLEALRTWRVSMGWEPAHRRRRRRRGARDRRSPADDVDADPGGPPLARGGDRGDQDGRRGVRGLRRHARMAAQRGGGASHRTGRLAHGADHGALAALPIGSHRRLDRDLGTRSVPPATGTRREDAGGGNLPRRDRRRIPRGVARQSRLLARRASPR